MPYALYVADLAEFMKWTFGHTESNTEEMTFTYRFFRGLGKTLRETLSAGEALATLLRQEGEKKGGDG
jgi:hypothetical protein